MEMIQRDFVYFEVAMASDSGIKQDMVNKAVECNTGQIWLRTFVKLVSSKVN